MKKTEQDPLRIQLEERRQLLNESEGELSEAKAALHSLDGKIRDLIDRRQNKILLKEMKEKDVEAAFKKVEEGKAVELTEELHRLNREIDALDQLHAAAIKSKDEAGQSVEKLTREVDGRIHAFWYAVSLIERRKVESNEVLIRAWIATQLGRTVQNFGQFLAVAFGGYSVPDLNGIREQLFRDYGRKEK